MTGRQQCSNSVLCQRVLLLAVLSSLGLGTPEASARRGLELELSPVLHSEPVVRRAPARREGASGLPPDICIRDTRCKALIQKAEELAKKGRHTEALDTYWGAYQLAPLPWMMAHIGRLEQLLGRCDQALKYYRIYQSNPPTDELSRQQRVADYVSECEQTLHAQRGGSLRRRFTPLSFAGIGLSLGTLLTGVVTGSLALHFQGQAESVPLSLGGRLAVQERHELAKSLAYATDVLLPLGAAGLAVTLIVTLARKPAERATPKDASHGT